MDRTKRIVLIFDGDDTLWETMPLYERTKRQFFVAMQGQGFDTGVVETDFERRDMQNVRRLGFSKKRFRISMLETYRTFCSRARIVRSRSFENRITRIADSVFRGKPKVAPYARQTLISLKGRCRLILLTKGELATQQERIRASGLKRFFDLIVIAPNKDTHTFRLILRRYKLRRLLTWSVGNSLRSDINPALRAGLRAIWIPRQTWRYEEEELVREKDVMKVSSLREVAKVVLTWQGT